MSCGPDLVWADENDESCVWRVAKAHPWPVGMFRGSLRLYFLRFLPIFTVSKAGASARGKWQEGHLLRPEPETFIFRRMGSEARFWTYREDPSFSTIITGLLGKKHPYCLWPSTSALRAAGEASGLETLPLKCATSSTFLLPMFGSPSQFVHLHACLTLCSSLTQAIHQDYNE